MDVTKLLRLIVKENTQRICFMCLKENEINVNIDDSIEIHEEASNYVTSIRKISIFLFPYYDLITHQACENCSKLIIEMFTTLKRGLSKIKMIQKITAIIDSKIESEAVLSGNKMTININVKEITTKMIYDKNASTSDTDIGTKSRGKTSPPLEYHEETRCHQVNVSDSNKCTRKLISSISKQARNNEILKCNKCAYKTINKQDLKSHQKKHLTKPYICTICQKGFYSNKNLIEHGSTHDKGRRIYVCDVCGEQYLYRKTLKIHIMGSHVNQKPFICEICGHRLVTISQKNEHIKRKHGPKEFNCNLCDKKYSLKKNLRRHITKIH